MVLAPQIHITPERSRYLMFQQTVLKPRSQESRQARRQRALNSRNASQTHNSNQPPIPIGAEGLPLNSVKNITGIKGTIHNAELVPKPARLEAGEAVSPRHQRTHGSNTDSAPLNFSPEIQRRHSKSASRQKILTKGKPEPRTREALTKAKTRTRCGRKQFTQHTSHTGAPNNISW